ncbi:MAG: hypothetical protein MUP16_11495 [Sedimentisphaerales bacterium]|nr:hypothetical protein [Sedimentisphaerales bacterium]
MDRQQIGLKLAIDGLGLPFKIDTFEGRLILQKAVYLAQAAGVHLGYYYQWYLHGPYSPSLTRDEYDIAEELARDMDDFKSWKLDADSLSTLKWLQKLVPERQKRRRKLELLASVHFLIERKQVQGRDVSQLSDILRRYNKDFSQDEIQQALEALDEYGLLPA